LQAFGCGCLHLYGEPPGAACVADARGAPDLAAISGDSLQHLGGGQLAAGIFQQETALDADRLGQVGIAEFQERQSDVRHDRHGTGQAEQQEQ